MNDEFDHLWQEFLDGGLGPAGFARLDAMLRNDPALTRHAADLYEEHRLIALELRAEPPERFQHAILARLQGDRDSFAARLHERLSDSRGTGSLPSPKRVAWRRFYAAAAMVAGLFAISWLTVRAFAPSAKTGAVPHIATVLRTEQAVWSAPWREGERLPPGSIELVSGSAVVRFDSGTMMVLAGPATLQLETRGSARLRRGQATVRVPEEAMGFTLRAPGGTLVDRGAEFVLAADASGATHVRVLEGEVEWQELGGNERNSRRLVAGQSSSHSAGDTSAPTGAAIEAPRMADLLRTMRRTARATKAEVYEGFDYIPGDPALVPLDGGTGWQGTWRPRLETERRHFEDTSPTPVIAGKSLTHPGVPSATGGALRFSPGINTRLRALRQGIDLGRDGVHYLSALVRRELGAAAAGPTPTRQSIRLTLRSSADYWGQNVTFALRQEMQPQIGCGFGITFSSPQSFPSGETLLLVGKIVARAKGEDEIFLRVFAAHETLEDWEPSEWTLSTRGIFADAMLDLLLITAGGDRVSEVDEIRIGATWDAVVTAPVKIAWQA